ncbi:MAG: tRNA (adenosine(37)-N6)-threonylcarbamoyltransferase complex dimerization subunit type 1 TsaB [bacterium]|nr:tRNA (adenosine(37)-N6)-threonylcarbamoyltransferase complex dimerization subunit type 1 TsaB [bacterium]
MIALALSGSNPTGEAPFSCALRIGERIHGATSPAGQRGDVARLAADLLATHGIAPAEIDELRIDLGPGSYTGLRVAITFVRFLTHFGSVRALACDTLALVATTIAEPHERLRPVLDARRGHWHSATFATNGPQWLVRDEARALSTEELLTSVSSADKFVVPPGLDATMRDRLAEAAPVVTTTGAVAERLFDERLPLQECSPNELEPRYLMASYAE